MWSLAIDAIPHRAQPNPELVLIVALNTWVSSVLTNEWFHADVQHAPPSRAAGCGLRVSLRVSLRAGLRAGLHVRG